MTAVEVCGCYGKADPEGWHRYRGQRPCEQAADARRDYDRRKYARHRQAAGKTVTPHGTWRTGSPIYVPEVDPL